LDFLDYQGLDSEGAIPQLSLSHQQTESSNYSAPAFAGIRPLSNGDEGV
jgi:hypothetical protein